MATSKSKRKSVFESSKKAAAGEAYTIWQAMDWTVVCHLVVMAARAGGTVQLGCTQNGSAATLRIYHEGVGETFYGGDVDTIEDLCRHWAEVFEGILD